MMTEQNAGSFQYDVNKVSEELHVRPEILNRLITSFSKSLAQRMVDLENAMNKDDIIKMRAILHEIRGTAGNLRLEQIASSCKILHETVKSEQNKEKIPEYLKALKASVDALIQHIEKTGE